MKNEIFQPGFEKNRKEGKIEKKKGKTEKFFKNNKRPRSNNQRGPVWRT